MFDQFQSAALAGLDGFRADALVVVSGLILCAVIVFGIRYLVNTIAGTHIINKPGDYDDD